MLGDGLACWDFDHIDPANPPAAVVEIVQSVEPVWAEVSVSGHGLHVFVWSDAPSHKQPGIEFYSHSRFIRVTERRWESALW